MLGFSTKWGRHKVAEKWILKRSEEIEVSTVIV